jgi:hypothetical protein
MASFTYTNWHSPSQRRRERERQVILAELQAEKKRRARQLGETSAAYLLRSAREARDRGEKRGLWFAIASDMLQMLNDGLGLQQIADRLGLSKDRAKWYRQRVNYRFLFLCDGCGGTGDGPGLDNEWDPLELLPEPPVGFRYATDEELGRFEPAFPPACRDCNGTGRVGTGTR